MSGIGLKGLEPDEDLSFEKILNNMLDGSTNLELKSQIHKPKQLASLVVLSDYLKAYGYKKSSGILNAFIKKYLRYMVSFERQSRTEIVKALTQPREEMKEEKNKLSKKL